MGGELQINKDCGGCAITAASQFCLLPSLFSHRHTHTHVCSQKQSPLLPNLQAAAVRPVLPGPAYGANPDLDRPYAAARIKKAMAGDAAAGAAATGREVPLPWQAGADAAASRASLERVLKECDALGPPADWIRYGCWGLTNQAAPVFGDNTTMSRRDYLIVSSYHCSCPGILQHHSKHVLATTHRAACARLRSWPVHPASMSSTPAPRPLLLSCLSVSPCTPPVWWS